MTNTVTQQQIDALLEKAEIDEQIISFAIFQKTLVTSYKLENGWQIVEKVDLIDPAGSIEIARKITRDKVSSELWELERYLLQNRLYEEKKLQAKLHEVNKLV